MFFVTSKIFWFLFSPGNFLLTVLFVSACLAFTRLFRYARIAGLGAAALLVLCGLSPLSALMLRPLEERFLPPQGDIPTPTGIIVLGGGIESESIILNRFPSLNDSGTRMVELVALSRRFPNAKLVFSGGSGFLNPTKQSESDAAHLFFNAMGVDPTRIVYEDRSRNTFENAVFTHDLVRPQPGETWILVTSAYHMPRAMGIFRAIDFSVIPWPAGYMTFGNAMNYRIESNMVDGLRRTEVAMREWIGLLAYWLTKRSDSLFPGPDTPHGPPRSFAKTG